MRTPWEKYYNENDGQDAEFVAWQKWIVEHDTNDAIEYVELSAMIFFYGMFLQAVEHYADKSNGIKRIIDDTEK